MSIVVASWLALAEPTVPPPPSPETIELHWEAPEPCPTAAAIEATYLALLSGPPVGSGTLYVDATVEHVGATWTLELRTEFRGTTDERELRSSSCDELAEATATLLAVALEPGLASEDPPVQRPRDAVAPKNEPAAESAVVPEPPPSSAPAPAKTPARPPARVPVVRGLLRPLVGVEYGALPGVTAYAGIGGGLVWPRARLEIDAGWLAPREDEGPGGTRLLAQMVVAAVHGCVRARVGVVELPVCGGVEGGFVNAAPRGLDAGEVVRGPWLGPSVRVGVAYARRRVGVFGAVSAVGRAWGTRLLIDDDVVFRQEIASLRLLVGLEVFFGRAQP